MFEAFFDQYASGYAYYKPGQAWCYEDGCLYRGLLELYRATGEDKWSTHLTRLIEHQIGSDGSLRAYRASEYNIDNILAGRVLFALGEDGDARYGRAADQLAAQLASHPRTGTGNYWHKQIYPRQIWLDGLYMGLPFQTEYGLVTGDEALVEDACVQLLTALNLMRDPTTGLYYHGYDESRAMAWADPETGLSQSFWGRANGWLIMALADMLDLLPRDHRHRVEITKKALALGDAILAYRQPSGLWLQVMDRPGLEGNYEELSGSAMFVYALLRISRVTGENGAYVKAALAALDSMQTGHVRRGGDGIWRLHDICEVAGLGSYKDRTRDGTPEYYVQEPIVSNDAKGVGPLMMAIAESERLGMRTLRQKTSLV